MYKKPNRRTKNGRFDRLSLQILCCLLIVAAVNAEESLPEGKVRESFQNLLEYGSTDHTLDQATAALAAVSGRLRAAPEVRMTWPCNESDSLALESDTSSHRYSFLSDDSELQVFSACGGIVTEAADGRIVIDHGNSLKTVYEGCTDVYVRTLQKVRRGEMIASVRGSEEEKPELGFQILKQQQPVDIGDYF